MAELEDALDLGSSGPKNGRGGSSPPPRTKPYFRGENGRIAVAIGLASTTLVVSPAWIVPPTLIQETADSRCVC